MTDLSQTIAPKSDQLNADDLIAGPKTITVTRVSAAPSSADQPVAISFDGDDGKPYKPCKSMRRVLVHLWGRDGAAYAGRQLRLFRDPTVRFGGIEVGGIRISHMSHIDGPKTLALTATRASRKPYTVQPLDLGAEFQFSLRDSRGTIRTTANGDQWAGALEAMLAKAATPAEAGAIANANSEFVIAAEAAGYKQLAQRVRAAVAKSTSPGGGESAGADAPEADGGVGGDGQAPPADKSSTDAKPSQLEDSIASALLDCNTPQDVASVELMFAADIAAASADEQARIERQFADVREAMAAHDDDFPGDRA